MIDLSNPKVSFIIVNPEMSDISELQNNWNCERTCSVLYSKDFTLFPIKELYKNKYTRAFLGISPSQNNDEIRQDAIQILEFLDINDGVIKYLGDKNPTKIDKFGRETPLIFSVYESDENSRIFIHEGISFAFVEQKRYFIPKKKEHLKEGMMIEYFNNNMWNKKQILKLNEEFEKMYKLLMKYEKIRIATE